MKKKVKLLTGLVILSVFSINSFAQMGKEDGSRFGHGEDSIRCVRSLSLYRENVKNKSFDYALEDWKTVFDECPKASKNIYLDGVKIYSHLINTRDPQEKGNLVDTLMLIYDRRIEYYKEKGKVRGRQGADLLKYRRNDGIEYVKQGYGYLKESMELMGPKTSNAVLPTLLSASITLFNQGEADAKQVIEDYMAVSKIIDGLIANKPNDKRLQELKASLDKNFVSEGPGECETLIEYFTEEHKTKKEDVEFLKMLTSLLRSRECTDAELFFIAAKDLHILQPSAGSALNIAILARNKEKYNEAISYYNQAIELEEDTDKTADYYLEIAIANQKLGNKVASREAARTAASVRQGFGKPYIIIGQLYADSKSECASIKLPKSIYWVAVDMFNKAKSIDPSLEETANKLISSYKAHYPNKEDAFFEGINEGDSFKVGCWINTTTIARF